MVTANRPAKATRLANMVFPAALVSIIWEQVRQVQDGLRLLIQHRVVQIALITHQATGNSSPRSRKCLPVRALILPRPFGIAGQARPKYGGSFWVLRALARSA